MQKFAVGQRWLSQTENELGVGAIVEVESRQIKIVFPTTNEQRIYAIYDAPLIRIEYKIGDEIQIEKEIAATVTNIESHDGRLIYHARDSVGKDYKIDEVKLNYFVELDSTKQRLLSGQLDTLKDYKLRTETLLKTHNLQKSSVRGLLGSRTNLLAHQIYVAHEVAKRYAPRVLLADEVGLGKTIEAGMIIHYQLETGLAKRILIIVPNSLVHQWFVEMLRKFNLHFAIFNEERIQALSDVDNQNIFESEQLVICPIEHLINKKELLTPISSANWDMLVVDEAHHLQLGDNNYHCIEVLAKKCRGVLLLTATPEQVGIESHFSRLRLLDPARFYDLDVFLKQEKQYKDINILINIILDQPSEILNKTLINKLKKYLGYEVSKNKTLDNNERINIVNSLLDLHGTGRIFFRNTRKSVKGFPKRNLKSKPLEMPDIYISLSGKDSLFPEQEMKNETWLKQDPRVSYMLDTINYLKHKKILVICANAKTAILLDKFLRVKQGICSSAFHEGLNIIERDRSASYFASDESGAKVLVCSEIGSEGRNFQFVHDLFLFDLPLNPDLLEQRIGRLDRIGQNHDINIYTPYIKGTAQEVLFKWYNKALNIFNENCSFSYSIYAKFKQEISNAIDNQKNDISQLIKDTIKYYKKIDKNIYKERKQLIELNSCRKDIADNLIDKIKLEEQTQLLMNYMELMFDCWGVNYEKHSNNTWILSPSNYMRINYFPYLKADDMTVTFERKKALIREDLSFISWEHPMVSEAMEMVLNSEIGNTTITTIKKKDIPAGTILLETFSKIKVIAQEKLASNRYLPISPFRTLIDKYNKDYSSILTYEELNELSSPIEQNIAIKIIQQIKAELEKMINLSIEITESKLPYIKTQAKQRISLKINREIKRLEELKKKNNTIRTEEIIFLEKNLSDFDKIIKNTKYELQAIRLIIVQ